MKEEIIAYCSQLGLENIGFIKCRKFDELKAFYEERKNKKRENEFEESDIEKRINPNHYMEEGKTIISIVFPYSHGVQNNNSGFSVYTMGKDYHRVVKSYLDKICGFIEDKGGKAISFVDSNTLPERYIAALSGVGFIGKNNLLITEKYGSYVFLGEIITDLEIYEEDKTDFDEITEFKRCGSCEICYAECPTKSINRNVKNSNICLSYLTQKKELLDWEVKALKGRLFGCDSCQLKCPFNFEKEKSFIDDFTPLEFIATNNSDDILEMGNKEFKNTYKITSCGWRGKNVLKRNALIRKKLYEKEDISDFKAESPYLEEYKSRLLQK